MRTRILSGEELGVLAEIPGGPFYERPEVVAQLGTSLVVVLEEKRDRDGDPPWDWTIVGYWPIWVAVHLEPLWLAPAIRKHPTAARQIVEGMRDALAAERITTAFAVIGHEDLVTHLPMAARLGFERMPGDLFFLRDVRVGSADGSSSDSGDLSGGAVLRQPGGEEAQRPGAEHGDDGPPRLGD